MAYPARIGACRRQAITPGIVDPVTLRIIAGRNPRARPPLIVSERCAPLPTGVERTILVAIAAPVVAGPAAVAITQVFTIFAPCLAQVLPGLAHITPVAPALRLIQTPALFPDILPVAAQLDRKSVV